MNPTWQIYLQSRNAVIEDNRVLHYGEDPAELRRNAHMDTVMVDLSHFGLIRFSGEDAHTFLQSQLSCDIRQVNSHTAQYGSYCTPKGRILANFLLWQDNDFLMQLPADLCTTVQKRLSLFVLRAKVQLIDNSDALIRIGIAGNNAAKLAEETAGMPLDHSQPLGVIHNELISLLCYAPNRYEFVTSIEHAPTLWARLNQYAKPVGAFLWDWLEIQAGIPTILPVTQEQFIPQMVNLDAIDAISFKKGCYPGQEIVARTQYLGKIKRRMYLAHIASTQSIMAGDELFNTEMANQSCGKIVNAAPSPHGGTDVLAVIQVSSTKAGSIHWQTPSGPTLEINPLPYPLGE